MSSSSFRDSTFTDQDFGGGDDGSDSNGIEIVFEGGKIFQLLFDAELMIKMSQQTSTATSRA